MGDAYFDEMTGERHKPDLVHKAMEEELAWVKRQGVYEKVPIAQCYDETGRRPVTLKCVHVNKGDEEYPRYRSRLVVREIRKKGQRVLPDHMLFSSMPPLATVKLLCSAMTSMKESEERSRT